MDVLLLTQTKTSVRGVEFCPGSIVHWILGAVNALLHRVAEGVAQVGGSQENALRLFVCEVTECHCL